MKIAGTALVLSMMVLLSAIAPTYGFDCSVPLAGDIVLFRCRGNVPGMSGFERAARTEKAMTLLLSDLMQKKPLSGIVVVEKQSGVAMPKSSLGYYDPAVLRQLKPYRDAKALFANNYLVVLALTPEEMGQNDQIWVENLRRGLCRKVEELQSAYWCSDLNY